MQDIFIKDKKNGDLLNILTMVSIRQHKLDVTISNGVKSCSFHFNTFNKAVMFRNEIEKRITRNGLCNNIIDF